MFRYPEIEAFKAMRQTVDPGNMFLNNYLRRVLGVEEGRDVEGVEEGAQGITTYPVEKK